jgi:branched-subunit amino acid aminotransferase/4-amino-4-deoxychorismate lyase
MLSRLKTTSYLVNVLARMEAEAAGADEALLRNERGFIVEGSASNIFFVQESKLTTPSLESGILPGITREAVIELARSLKIDVREDEVRLDEFGDYDEVFLTNSVMELMPLVRVRDREGRAFKIGSGKPGPVTGKLMAAYKKMVARKTTS